MKKLAIALFVMLALGVMTAAAGGDKDRQGMEKGSAMLEKAIFAGGCFWCMEPPFEKLDGVVSVTAGYTGGQQVNPTYEEVSSGRTGHAEAVEILFDPAKVSFEKLLEVFWMNIDPTDARGQFVDRGSQYRSAIFVLNEEQKRQAEASRDALAQTGRFEGPIVAQIVPASTFYPAEEYHQDYYRKNSIRYKFFRYNSGRDQFLDKEWGEERKKL
jgi:methionine-S-sulfoxide reductase